MYLRLFAGLALACVVTPAFAAADCAHQLSDVLKVAKKDGAVVIGNLKAKAPMYDHEVVVLYPDGSQSLWFFAKGCLIGPPAVLSPATEPPDDGAPAPAAPAPKPTAGDVGA